MSVITPFGVDIIAIPNPLLTFGKLSALEKILLPGLETLSIELITGLPDEYFRLMPDNVYSIGRAGSYRYQVDIDDCIEQAKEVSDNL